MRNINIPCTHILQAIDLRAQLHHTVAASHHILPLPQALRPASALVHRHVPVHLQHTPRKHAQGEYRTG